MELIRGLYNLKARHQGSVATIGNFDGVHLGHRAVIEQLKQHAQRLGRSKTLITFEPLPAEFFQGNKAPARLTTLGEKLKLLQQLGIEQVLCLPFREKLAATPAEQFIQQVLVEGLGIKLLVVGDDFRFGKNRQGDFTLLKKSGEQYGFEVYDTQTLTNENSRVSSSRIRQALREDNLKLTAKLLGRQFTLSGRVIHGDKRGRQLGFPTANIRISRQVSPLQGVYAIRAHGAAQHTVNGVANIGTRPTVNNRGFLLEANLFDFSDDIYGHRMTIEIVKKIRGEKKFESLDSLKQQIHQDIQTAKEFLTKATSCD